MIQIAKGAYVHPSAVLMGDVQLSSGASVWPLAVLRGDLAPVFLGENSNVQDGCVLHVKEDTPVHIGRQVVVGHGCILHGCTIGDGVLVGMGSVVMDGARLESGCMVGAGSLVTENTVIPSGMLALGRPAKVVRPLSKEEQAAVRQSADKYVLYAEKARQEQEHSQTSSEVYT